MIWKILIIQNRYNDDFGLPEFQNVTLNENEGVDMGTNTTQPNTSDEAIQTSKKQNEIVDKTKLLWHRRLGHMNGKYLKYMSASYEDIPKTFKFGDDDFKHCFICIEAKATKLGHGGNKMQNRFELKVKHDPTYFLGLKIDRQSARYNQIEPV